MRVLLLVLGTLSLSCSGSEEAAATDPPFHEGDDVLAGTAWGRNEHGWQRIRFGQAGECEADIADRANSDSHWTLEFEEDGFDFGYLTYPIGSGDDLIGITIYDHDYTEAFEYGVFRFGEKNGVECLFLSELVEDIRKRPRAVDDYCWPRDP